ncbi:MAG: M16 family metallopeptidase, partial [Pyrinomonadaceae bacterium]
MLKRYARTFTVFSLLLATAAGGFAAQGNAQQPQREQLLNGLPILLWSRPGEQKVLLKLRINSGAAFDLANKEGMTLLLADALFPDPTTRQYVTEELGGRLDVRTTYDAIDIALGGRVADFERLVEVLRNAVVNMRLAEAEIAAQREGRVKGAKESAGQPARVADGAAAARLFGPHPYARLLDGTAESLSHVERADLMLARDRFINPNNATLVVIGGIERSRALRALRQYLGVWRKSDAQVPASFRRPETQPAKTLLLDQPGSDRAEVRLALKGVSRSDRDQAPASLLAVVAGNRWQTALEVPQSAASARHDAHSLSGLLLLSANVPSTATAATISKAQGILKDLAASPVSAAELERAKRSLLDGIAKRRAADADVFLADQWLDAATYGLPTNHDEAQVIDAISTADLQRVAARLFTNQPVVSVVVGDAAQLKPELSRLPDGFETPAPAGKPAAPAATPQTNATFPARRP